MIEKPDKNVDYTSRYGLDFNPFIKASQDAIIETTEYKELTLRLNYLVELPNFNNTLRLVAN